MDRTEAEEIVKDNSFDDWTEDEKAQHVAWLITLPVQETLGLECE